MKPAVTVIIATYNWPKALAEAITTALNQTFSDFELLIVGDCCTDETAEVVHSFKDKRIRWHNLSQNTGNQSGVNKVAISMAQGEVIAYLNHDDLWFPDHLETLIDPLRKRELDIVSSLCLEIGANGEHYRSLLGLPHQIAPGKFRLAPMTTSVMHTAKAAADAGGWIDWRETHRIPTLDFFNRVRSVRNRFAVVSSVTALKFHSGDRLNSYASKDASEQAFWASRMKNDLNLRLRETMTAIACQAMHEQPQKLLMPEKPKQPPPGWQIEQWRRMRGLRPMLDLGESEPKDFQYRTTPRSLVDYDENAWPVISSTRDRGG